MKTHPGLSLSSLSHILNHSLDYNVDGSNDWTVAMIAFEKWSKKGVIRIALFNTGLEYGAG